MQDLIINIYKIRKAFDLIMDRAIEIGFSEIRTSNDYYWSIEDDDRVNFNTENPEKVVGSLFDDYSELMKIL